MSKKSAPECTHSCVQEREKTRLECPMKVNTPIINGQRQANYGQGLAGKGDATIGTVRRSFALAWAVMGGSHGASQFWGMVNYYDCILSRALL